jgi:vacuolar-type H+-ATPase subunit E/Vma4
LSLQAILERIQAIGEAQGKEIRQQGEQEAEVILAEARALGEQAYQDAYRQAHQRDNGADARILNQARFEALCLLGNARERLVQETLDQLSQQLQGIRQQAIYADILQRNLLELLHGQNSRHSLKDRLILEADPRDRELLEKILQALGFQIQVDYILNSCGGLNARYKNGTVRLVNTLESRMERAMPYLKQQLAARFEQQKAAETEEQLSGARA